MAREQKSPQPWILKILSLTTQEAKTYLYNGTFYPNVLINN